MKQLNKMLFALLFISSLSFAGWPQFYVLHPTQVLNLIDVKDCAPGFGKIPFGTKVEIINRYIPKNQKWYWVFSGDGQCKKLPQIIHYNELQPAHTAVYSGSAITIYYGEDTKNLFSFTFTVPDGNCPDNGCPWSCGSFSGSPPDEIGCAQDTN